MPLVRCRRLLFSAVIGVAAFVPVRAWAQQQDTTWREGVRIVGAYSLGTRPGMLVLPVTGSLGDSLRAIFQRDFEFGGRMNVIALPSASVPPANSNGSLNYPLLARLGANVVLQVQPTTFGIRVAIHDVAKGSVARAKAFSLPSPAQSPSWRMALHVIADDVEQQVTAVRGISATRIAYVSQGRVWQVDSDGASAATLTGEVGAMSPSWSSRGTHLAYTTLPPTGAQIVIREMGGATRVLGVTPGGVNLSPAFARDGSTLAWAHGKENGTDIYVTNAFGTEPARRITVGRGSDNMSPTFSPDGRRMAFTTNRAGSVQIYTADADGTNANVLIPFSFGDQSYRSDPEWSPDGRHIAFQAQIAGNFQIMTVNVRDKSIRTFTSTGVNENPSFAPDSRHLVFTSTRGGSRQLWVLDTETSTFRQLTRAPGGARHGAWSPSLAGK